LNHDPLPFGLYGNEILALDHFFQDSRASALQNSDAVSDFVSVMMTCWQCYSRPLASNYTQLPISFPLESLVLDQQQLLDGSNAGTNVIWHFKDPSESYCDKFVLWSEVHGYIQGDVLQDGWTRFASGILRSNSG